MRFSIANLVAAGALIALGFGFAAAGIYVGHTDDAPGAALLCFVLMAASMALGVRTAMRKTPLFGA